MADLSPLLGQERKSDFGAVRSVDDPKRTCGRLALCLKVLTSAASIGTKQAMKRRKIQHGSGTADGRSARWRV
jgi:hypothetical protein